MMCSTHTMVIPSSPGCGGASRRRPLISAWSSPPRLSSARRSRGPVASARASSSFLRPPAPSRVVAASGSAGRPTRRRISAARDAGLRLAGARLRAVVRGHRHVLEDGQLAEGPRDLEGAGDAPVADAVGSQPADLGVLEPDGAGGGDQRARHAVEQRGLAGAIGPDEAEDLALADGEGHGVEGGEAPELLGESR